MGWSDRQAWASETPLDYPHLNPVAALRFDSGDLAAGEWPDAVDGANTWIVEPWVGSANAIISGPRGRDLGLNRNNPATEQGKLTLPFFPGLWPSSGKLLMCLWVKQAYTMTFNPLMSSRSGTPVAYLSTYTTGRLRHQVYDSSGSLVLDLYEDSPWNGTTDWQWCAMLVDFDAQTSQAASVDPVSHRRFLSPVRPLAGAPNPECESPLEVFALPGAGYWTGGEADEVIVAHPGSSFDFEEFVERVRLGTWANAAAPTADGKLTVSDAAVVAEAAHTFETGAEPVSWTARPEPSRPATAYWSTDDGATWNTGTLPTSLTGLLRWSVALDEGDVFTGIDLLPPSPTLAPISDAEMTQQDELVIPLDATWTGLPTWTVAATAVTATVEGTDLVIDSGWATGSIPITVTLRDEWDRAVSRTFTLTVTPLPYTPAEPPQYPRSPIVVCDENGDPSVAILDPLSAVVTNELNGEQTLEFSVPVSHRHAGALLSERAVEHAGERYRIRRITTGRTGRAPAVTVFCEAAFYDLAYAGQIEPREYLQVPAGTAMADALEGTGWTINRVTVETRRTYTVEETNPLALLRLIQKQHGGDLVFDNVNRTVSLVTQSGRDVGVSFFYGRGLTESKRVVDTTSLVTRIYARNAEGVTIAGVNGGLPYVEDLTWTSEIREATYDFASGTSPFTMLAMAQATLANRARPSFSYEFTVSDLSYRTGQELDRFDVGDVVTVIDDELGIRETQRIVRVEHDVTRPWASKITLSAKLREQGDSSQEAAGPLTTGTQFNTFDLVPFNALRNGRFDNGLAHWASSGVTVVAGRGTGDNAVRFQGSGTRWIEQTVAPDNRDVYALSLRADAVDGGAVPPLTAIVTVEYEDGSTDTIPVELA